MKKKLRKCDLVGVKVHLPLHISSDGDHFLKVGEDDEYSLLGVDQLQVEVENLPKDGDLVTAQVFVPGNWSEDTLEKRLTEPGKTLTISVQAHTYVHVTGESREYEPTTLDEILDAVNKAKHKKRPTDREMAKQAKESTDGVVLLSGRYLGESYCGIAMAAFDPTRFTDDQQSMYLKSRGHSSAEGKKVAGAILYELRSNDEFAPEGFKVVDPVTDSVYYSEELWEAAPHLQKREAQDCEVALQRTDPGYADIGKTETKTFFIEFKKVQATIGKDMFIRSVAYPADRIDAHEEYADGEELKNAAHDFAAFYRTINVEHTSEIAKGVDLVESFIATADEPEIECFKGDWAVVLRVTDETTKLEIQEGVYKGLSIEGRCKKKPGMCKGVAATLLSLIQVYKISLVENPATRLAFVAKHKGIQSQSADAGVPGKTEKKVGPVMDELKKLQDAVQTAVVELGRLVKADVPQQVPDYSFKGCESPEAAKLLVMERQSSFLCKFVENILEKSKEIQEDAKKQAEEIGKKQELIDEAQEKIDGYQKMEEALREDPNVDAFYNHIATLIEGSPAKTSTQESAPAQ